MRPKGLIALSLLLFTTALVFWVRLQPLAVRGVDPVADKYARFQARLRLARDPANQRLSARELETRLDQWIAHNQAQFNSERDATTKRFHDALRYQGSDGAEHTYLGDQDSYTWLRLARNYMQHGTTCDTVVDGECRDNYVNAPVGTRMVYARSLHIAAIVVLHKLITFFKPDYPLPASSFWLPVLLGTLAVFPAFAIGRRLAGDLGGFATAFLTTLHPVFLGRSIGSDNDIWNVTLPLFVAWAAMSAAAERSLARQVAWAALAAAFVGLHAATWSGWIFSYAAVATGLSANLLFEVLRDVVRHRAWRPQMWQSPALRGAAVVLVVFVAATGLAALVAGEWAAYAAVPAAVLSRFRAGGVVIPPPMLAIEVGVWPDVLGSVTELQRSPLAGVVGSMYGAAYMLAAMVGLLFLLLPTARWSSAAIAVFVAGTALDAFTIWQADLDPSVAFALVVLPLAAAVVVNLLQDDRRPTKRANKRRPAAPKQPQAKGAARGVRSESEATGPRPDDEKRGQEESTPSLAPALIALGCFLGGLQVAFGGVRFYLLFVPGLGMAIGAALGRIHQCATSLVRQRLPRYGAAASVLLGVALCGALIIPFQQGYAAARDYIPGMNDAWWDTFTNLREHTAPDAIINTWWDYGYWAKYVAERGVTEDGATLLTHLPYWMGRAMVSADEAESAGLLRMLNCVPDSTPLRDGRGSAYNKILDKTKDAERAHSMTIEVARRDRQAAAAYLAEHGFNDGEQTGILAASHCNPAEAYLILSEELTRKDTWMRLGLWDFRRAYIASRAKAVPEAEAVTDFSSRFGYKPEEAKALYHQARTLPRADFVIGPAPRAPSVWYPCRPGPEPSTMQCPLGLMDTASKRYVEAFVFNVFNPSKSRLRYRPAEPGRPPGAPVEVAPGALVVAESQLLDVALPEPRYAETGILMDTRHWSILIGPPPLIRSTFIHLLFLDGRYAKHFEKFSDYKSYNEDRIVTWKLKFDG